MWDFIDRRVAALELAPQSLDDLSRAVQNEWQSIPQNYVDILVCSMTRCVSEIIKRKGCCSHFKYVL